MSFSAKLEQPSMSYLGYRPQLLDTTQPPVDSNSGPSPTRLTPFGVGYSLVECSRVSWQIAGSLDESTVRNPVITAHSNSVLEARDPIGLA